MGRQIDIGAELGEGVAETGAGQGCERRFGEEEGLAGGMPSGAIVGQSAAGDQAMDMRVEDQSLGPGVQHGEDADGAADPTRVAAQIDDRRGGGLHQRAIAGQLVAAQDGAEFLRHCEGDVEIGNR